MKADVWRAGQKPEDGGQKTGFTGAGPSPKVFSSFILFVRPRVPNRSEKTGSNHESRGFAHGRPPLSETLSETFVDPEMSSPLLESVEPEQFDKVLDKEKAEVPASARLEARLYGSQEGRRYDAAAMGQAARSFLSPPAPSVRCF
jgi:hypothetical protein